MNEVRLEIYVDGNGNCTMHSGAASNGEIIKTLVNVLAAVCAEAARDEATDKTKLLSAVCVQLYRIAMNSPKYTVGDDDEQKEG